jgi:hypothetical protein
MIWILYLGYEKKDDVMLTWRDESMEYQSLSSSISSIVVAPVARGLSIFLLQHSSFFAILNRENEFGFVLVGLLVGVIMLSSVWFVVGIK